MSYRSYSGGRSVNDWYSPASLPLGVKWLLIVNVAMFLLYAFGARFGFAGLLGWMRLVPADVLGHFAVWELVTYQFLHDPGGFGHILFNMLMLWMFGGALEPVWGTRRFVQFYLMCGVGAGLLVVLAGLLFNDRNSATIGASGAILGLIAAFGVLFAESTILFQFLFPIKAKYVAMIAAAIALLGAILYVGDNVSHIAHLGGMITGYLLVRAPTGKLDPLAKLFERYQDWKMRRAKRKFQLYLKKSQADRDRFVH